jgi:endoglucanase
MTAVRRILAKLAVAAALAMGGVGPGHGAEAASAVRSAGRGGSLLPQGWLSTRDSRIVDAGGNVVRIASIGWYGTDGPAGYALQGLWAASYRAICDSIVAAGFNTVRIP